MVELTGGRAVFSRRMVDGASHLLIGRLALQMGNFLPVHQTHLILDGDTNG